MSVEIGQSDAELLEAIRGGNAAAYGSLYKRHAAAARALARQLVQGETEVEDVVAETFTKILDVIHRGAGPQAAFRPALLTALRRTIHARSATNRDTTREPRNTTTSDPPPFETPEPRDAPPHAVGPFHATTSETDLFNTGQPFVDPALAGLERSLIARAFLSLPERWQLVLWHTEVENARPTEVAPLLGLSANGVAALAHRAREGLRQAYLRMHLSTAPRQSCRPMLAKMGAYVRGGLAKRESRLVDEHVAGCADCRAVLLELTVVNQGLRVIVGPLIAGPGLNGYLTAISAKTRRGLLRSLPWFGRGPKPRPTTTRKPPRTNTQPPAGSPQPPTTSRTQPLTKPFELAADHSQPAGGHVQPAMNPHQRGANEAQPGAKADQPVPKPQQPGAKADQPSSKPHSRGTRPQQRATRPTRPGAKPRPARTRPQRPGTAAVIAATLATATATIAASGFLLFSQDRPLTAPPVHPTPPITPPIDSHGYHAPPIALPAESDADLLNAATPPTRPTPPTMPPAHATRPSHAIPAPTSLPPLSSLAPGQQPRHAAPLPNPRASHTSKAPISHPATHPTRNTGTDTGTDLAVDPRPDSGTDTAKAKQPAEAKHATTPERGTPDHSPTAHATPPKHGIDPDHGTGPEHETRPENPAPARLVATIDPIGSLVRAQPGIIAVRLRNTGGGTSAEIRATIELPKGVTLLSAGGRKGASVGGAAPIGTVDGWSCRVETKAVLCVRPGLAGGRSTAVFLRVQVAQNAPIGKGLAVQVKAGKLSAVAHSTAGVRASGATARFAADGHVMTRAIGNTLLTCPKTARGCAAARARMPGRLDNDLWPMVALDLDHDRATSASSAALLSLPRDARVVWAGLYWSATGDTDGRIKLRGPGSSAYTKVRASEVARRQLPVGPGYQAFADVTRLVRGRAGGRWWVADPSLRTGVSRHAGWSLVVVAADPHLPYRQAAVLDTATVVNSKKGLDVPLSGLSPAATPARLDIVTWDGDAGLKGDALILKSGTPHKDAATDKPTERALRPDSGERDPQNVFDSSAETETAGAAASKAVARPRLRLDTLHGMDAMRHVDSMRDVDGTEGVEEIGGVVKGWEGVVGGWETGERRRGAGGQWIEEGRWRAEEGRGARVVEGVNSFGVDVDVFHPVLGRDAVLRVVTRRDVLFFGVVAVSVAGRS